jgi:hypothetical protein
MARLCKRRSPPQAERATGLLSRLAGDRRGNTLAMMAAALIPLTGMIGSGLDMARAYMTKAKLQTACDASALAARRFMAGNTLTQPAIDEGRRFFNFNFPPGTMQSTPVNLVIQSNSSDLSVVEVRASTTVPTTVMALFGVRSLNLSVACSADQDYVNNDIMVVLDVTGSMNCTAGTNCAYAATEQANSRLSRVRNATASLYRALQGATGVRTRYGFMPYSMTVNVGNDLDAAWLRSPATYANCTSLNGDGSCRTWGTAQSFATASASYTGCVEERSAISQNGQAAIRISPDVAQADIDSVSTTDARLKWQRYDPGRTVGEWDSTRIGNLTTFCPARATRLAVYNTEAAFQTQVTNSLSLVGGYTNHDLGMVWGARFLSGTGMFSASNPDTFNNMRVARHIIFLTDGDMTASDTNYSSFGIPAADPRMTGTGTQEARHIARFLNACNTVRQMPGGGVTIWVIALDTGAVSDIGNCASSSSHFFVSNGSDLDQVFTTIGRGIGRLRITE